MEKRRGESVPIDLMVPIFRKFVYLVTFVCFTSFFFLYFGTVQWHSYTNELVPIDEIDNAVPSSQSASSTTAKSTSKVVEDQIAANDKRSNPFGLTPAEILHQLETASIPSLKRRVKRFACWHSCFGPFRKKVLGRPYSLKATTTKPPSASPASATGKDKGKGKGKGKPVKAAPDNNELGDGEDEADILTPMQGKPRKKKASNPVDYFKLKTKVIVTRDTGSSTSTPRTLVPPEEASSPKNPQSEIRVVKSSATTRAPATTTKRPETKKTHPTKKPEPVFGSYVQKKKSTTAKPAQVAVKVQAKSESRESDEGKDSRGASDEGSASAEGESTEDDEGSDSEEESAEH